MRSPNLNFELGKNNIRNGKRKVKVQVEELSTLILKINQDVQIVMPYISADDVSQTFVCS